MVISICSSLIFMVDAEVNLLDKGSQCSYVGPMHGIDP